MWYEHVNMYVLKVCEIVCEHVNVSMCGVSMNMHARACQHVITHVRACEHVWYEHVNMHVLEHVRVV